MLGHKVCPDVAELEQWLCGELNSGAAEALETHVETCKRCENELGRLRVAPSWAAEIREGWQCLSESRRDVAKLIAQLKTVPVGLREVQQHVRPVFQVAHPARVGHFEILQCIGSGGMGQVFLAADTRLRRQVALKVIAPELMSTRPRIREYFLAEARAAASLRHDHIVTIYEVGDCAGMLYLAMELLHGETLQQFIAREQTLPYADILRIGLQISQALTVAHEAGIVHRDLKPANVWLEPQVDSFRVKLLDFGLAQQLEAAEVTVETQCLLGTPGYISPEQAQGGVVDGRADLFSLGCLLYRLAAEKLPFRGADMLESLYSLAVRQPVALESIRPDLPVGFAELVHALLDKQPQRRPGSAGIVAERLHELSCHVGDDSMPRRVALMPEANRTSRRWGYRLWLMLGLLLLGVGGFFVPPVIQVVSNRGDAEVGVRDQERRILETPEFQQGAPGGGVADAMSDVRPFRHGGLPQITAVTDAHRLAGTTYLRHWNWISALDISADGAYAMTGSYDSTAVVWDIARRVAFLRLSPQRNGVTSVAIHPDATTFATGCGDGYVKQWNADGRERLAVQFSTAVRTIDYSHDGRLFAAMTADTVCVYDTVTDEELWRLTLSDTAPEVAIGLAFSHDDGTLAICERDEVLLVDADAGRVLARHSVNRSATTCVAFSPESTLLAVGLAAPHPSVVILDPIAGTVWKRLEHPEAGDSATDVTFSHDGERVMATFGRPLVHGEADLHNTSRVRQWHVSDGTPGPVIAPPAQWTGFAAADYGANDGHIYATGRDLTCSIWDSATGARTEFPELLDYIYSFCVSPNAEWLAAAHYNGTVSLQRIDQTEPAEVLGGHGGVVSDVDWHPTGTRLVTSCTDDVIRCWDTANRTVMWTSTHRAAGVAYHAAGRVIAAGGRWFDTPLVLLDAEAGREIDTSDLALPVACTAFATQSDRSVMVVAGFENDLHFLDVPTAGGVTRVLDAQVGDVPPTASGFNALCISPRGSLLATAEGNARIDRGRVRLWSIGERRVLPTPPFYNRRIMSLSFVANERILATGGWHDSAVNLWDTTTGTLLHCYAWPAGAGSVMKLQPVGDGAIAALGSDGCVYRLPLPTALRAHFIAPH